MCGNIEKFGVKVQYTIIAESKEGVKFSKHLQFYLKCHETESHVPGERILLLED